MVSGRTRAEVSRKLAKLREDAAGGALATRSTVAEYLARWLEAERARLRTSTWRSRELHVRHYIIPALGGHSLGRMAPADVERMTTAMIDRGLSPRTAASCRVTLRRALGDALREGLVSRNVAALARPPRVPARSMEAGHDYLTPADLRTLLAAVAGQPMGPLVTVAATTGLRQGELLGLTWADMDLAARTLTVRRSRARAWVMRDGQRVAGWALQEPKTPRSRRTVNLPAAAVAALTQRKADQALERQAAGTAWQDTVGLTFTDAVGRPMAGGSVSHEFRRMVQAAGLAHIPFHGLRHSVATAMLAAGVPLRTVADVLGHSTITITADTYAAVVPELRRDAADAMDRVLGG
jgi:integrase